MRTVHKYQIPVPFDDFTLNLPTGAKVVRFAPQHGRLCVWLEVDLEQPLRSIFFKVVGTGFGIPQWYEHRGSCEAGVFIWHLYQLVVGDL